MAPGERVSSLAFLKPDTMLWLSTDGLGNLGKSPVLSALMSYMGLELPYRDLSEALMTGQGHV